MQVFPYVVVQHKLINVSSTPAPGFWSRMELQTPAEETPLPFLVCLFFPVYLLLASQSRAEQRCTMLVNWGRKQAPEDRNEGKVGGEQNLQRVRGKWTKGRRGEKSRKCNQKKKKKIQTWVLSALLLYVWPLCLENKQERGKNTAETASSVPVEGSPTPPRASKPFLWRFKRPRYSCLKPNYGFGFPSHATQTDSDKFRDCFRLWVYQAES